MAKKIKNDEILEAVANEASPALTTLIEDGGVQDLALSYNQQLRNELLDSLVAKIGKSTIKTKQYQSKYKEFLKTLENGAIIEDVFVDLAQSKGLHEHFEKENGAGSDEADLLSAAKQDVKSLVSSINYQKRYKATITQSRFKQAILNPEGLHTLTDTVAGTVFSSANADTDTIFMTMLQSATANKQLTNDGNGNLTLSANTLPGIKKVMKRVKVEGATKKEVAMDLLEKIKQYSEDFTFLSDEYNMAGVKTFSLAEDLMVLVTPEMKAQLDVQALASLFNLDKASINSRIVVVKELPKIYAETTGAVGTRQTETKAMLVDRNLLNYFISHEANSSFYNGALDITNIFYHTHGIASICTFANAVAFVAGDLA